MECKDFLLENLSLPSFIQDGDGKVVVRAYDGQNRTFLQITSYLTVKRK
jgi:hypothetical protein